MQHKVLLADDSLTIQKVIRITLSQQPYEIVDCSTEDELFSKLTHEKPRIVFLDFNLSDTHTGYELTSRIRELSPSTKVLLLLGTFDSIDDAAFEKCGASEKIVKPFDSNKFIAICKRLIEEGEGDEAHEEGNVFESQDNDSDEASIDDEDNQWTMNVPKKDPTSEKKDMSLDGSIPNLNPLESEISSWGMSIPGVIDSPDTSTSGMELPPVISEEKRAADARPKLPSSEDLDYPTFDEAPEPKSNLISIESFRSEGDTQEYELEGNFVADESDVKNIEDQIKDEVEGDLWSADEFIDAKTEMDENIERAQSFSPEEDEVTNDFDDSYLKPLDDKDSISWAEDEPAAPVKEETQSMPAIDQETLERMIEKEVRQRVDALFKEKVEKIAWEIIPDLAENLIRKELNSIAERIISQSK